MMISWARKAGLDVPDKKIGGYRYVVGCRELTAAESAEAGGQVRMFTGPTRAGESGKKADGGFDF